jgi:hypothetical protein
LRAILSWAAIIEKIPGNAARDFALSSTLA